MSLRVTGQQHEGFDVELEMQDGSVRRVWLPRGWVEHAGGHFYANLDANEHDLTELPTEPQLSLTDARIDESPTLLDRARGRRREELVARVISWRKRR